MQVKGRPSPKPPSRIVRTVRLPVEIGARRFVWPKLVLTSVHFRRHVQFRGVEFRQDVDFAGSWFHDRLEIADGSSGRRFSQRCHCSRPWVRAFHEFSSPVPPSSPPCTWATMSAFHSPISSSRRISGPLWRSCRWQSELRDRQVQGAGVLQWGERREPRHLLAPRPSFVRRCDVCRACLFRSNPVWPISWSLNTISSRPRRDGVPTATTPGIVRSRLRDP